MKIVNFEAGRATLLFPLEEVLPLEGYDSRVIFDSIVERYGFAIGPDFTKSRSEFQRDGFLFETGTMDFKESAVEVSSLSIFSDGIVVGATRTEFAESFADDLLSWLAREMGFRSPTSAVRRVFISHIVFELGNELSAAIEKNAEMAEVILNWVSPHFADVGAPRVARIEYEFDSRSDDGRITIPRVTIERRAGADKGVDRYFSSAPLRTCEHVDMLAALAKVMF